METMNVNSMGGGELLGKVEVDTDVIQTSIENLNAKSESLQEYKAQIDYAINTTLFNIWKGPDADNFISTSNFLLYNLDHIRSRIDQHANNLIIVKNAYESLDQEFGAKNCSA